MRRRRLARNIALLIPLACSDGAGPAPGAVLPSALTGGTYNVPFVVIPAGQQHTVAGNVVVIAEQDIKIDGTIVLLPGATLALAAGDSLVINGTVGPAAASVQNETAASVIDTTIAEPSRASKSDSRVASDSGTVSQAENVSVATLDLETLGSVYLIGQTVLLNSGSVVRSIQGISLRRDGTLLRVGGQLSGRNGSLATAAGAPGGDGGSVQVGTGNSNAFWLGNGITDVRVPRVVELSGEIRAGNGGAGFDDLNGVVSLSRLRTIDTRGGAGGDGGSIHIQADLIDLGAVQLIPGNGGRGGGCGSILGTNPAAVRGANGTIALEAGVSIDCITGDAGQPGTATLNGIVASNIVQPLEGLHGGVWVGAGNGGFGGAGGSIDVVVGTGLSQTGLIKIESGGSGGSATSTASMLGGNGGNITILSTTDGPVQTPIVFLGPVANGGNGFNGCLTSAFTPGSKGGNAGSLFVAGAPYTIAVGSVSFSGGQGGNGTAPGSGGASGLVDGGSAIGLIGPAGSVCVDFSLGVVPPSIVLNQGATTTATVSMTGLGGFGESVTLAAQNAGSGVNVTFTPGTIVSGSTATARFEASLSAAVATTTASIVGSAPGFTSRTAPVTVTVRPRPAITLSSNATSTAVTIGQSADYAFSVGRVNFDAPVDLELIDEPPNVAGLFSQNPVLGGTGNIVLTLTANGAATPGTFSVIVQASGAGVETRTLPFELKISPVPAIDLNLSTPNLTVSRGFVATMSASIERVGGFDADVTMRAENLATGVNVSFNPQVLSGPATSTVLTFSASQSAAIATSTASIIAAAPGLADRVRLVDVNVNEAAGFSMSMVPDLVTLPRSATTTADVTITRLGGFAGPVTLGVQGVSDGVSWIFTPPVVTGSTATVAFTATAGATLATSTATLIGTSPGFPDQTTPFTLTVVPSQTPPSISASVDPSTISVGQGQSRQLTVLLDRVNYADDIVLTPVGFPGDLSTSFSQNPVPNGVPSVTLTLTATQTAALGTTPTFIEASGVGVTPQSAPLQVTVTTPQSFSFIVSPPTVTVNRNATVTRSMIITRSAGMNGPIGFHALNVPDGVTMTFNPPTTGTSTFLTASASGTAAIATSTATIVGTSPGLPDFTFDVPVTVTDNPPNYSMSVFVSPLPVNQGATSTSTLFVNRQFGFNQTVTPTAGNVPSGGSITFSPAEISGTTAALIASAAPSTPLGFHSILVTATSAAFPDRTVSFTLNVLPPPTTCIDSFITVGQTATGALAITDCLSDLRTADPWIFTLTSNTTVQIDQTASFNTFMYLRNQDGTLIEFDDDDGDGSNSRITRALGPGTYVIWASSLFGATVTGPYTLTLTDVTPPGEEFQQEDQEAPSTAISAISATTPAALMFGDVSSAAVSGFPPGRRWRRASQR